MNETHLSARLFTANNRSSEEKKRRFPRIEQIVIVDICIFVLVSSIFRNIIVICNIAPLN